MMHYALMQVTAMHYKIYPIMKISNRDFSLLLLFSYCSSNSTRNSKYSISISFIFMQFFLKTFQICNHSLKYKVVQIKIYDRVWSLNQPICKLSFFVIFFFSTYIQTILFSQTLFFMKQKKCHVCTGWSKKKFMM